MNKNYYKKNLGNFGEERAVRYLERLGYDIIMRNFKSERGEIDIIAKDEKEYVFIEVKTRKNDMYGKPVDAVNLRKKEHITKTAMYYIHRNNLKNKYIRFDVIEVYVKHKGEFVNHIKNIFA